MMSSDHPHSGSPRLQMGGAFLATFILLSLPFWFTPFVPISDLPQHLCQIVLAKQVLSGEAPHLLIRWYNPNTLVYLLVAAWMAALPAVAAGKAVMLTLLAGWIGAVIYLAHQRRRSMAAAIIACVLAFNLSWYWGFINFLVGWPIFALFVARLGATERPVKAWELVVLSVGLLLAHALWFLMASVVLFVHCLCARPEPWPARCRRLAAWIPGGLYAVVWFVFFSESVSDYGFNTAPQWRVSPLARFHPTYWGVHVLGGLPTEWTRLFLSALIVWLLASAATHVRNFRSQVDGYLLLVAAIVGFSAVVMPTTFMATVLFNTRWLAIAGILLILAMPPPRFHPAVLTSYALLVVLTMGCITSRHWRGYYRDGLSGLSEALDAVPDTAHVVGLDYQHTTKWIRHRPFMHTFAYAQALHGVPLNFSFSDHASVLVMRKAPRENTWPFEVEWHVSLMEDVDYRLFDIALVHGSQADHQTIAGKPFLSAITTGGMWRTYQIDPHHIPEYTDEPSSP